MNCLVGRKRMLRGEVRTAPWLGAVDILELSSVLQKGVNQRPPCHTGVVDPHSVLYTVGLLVGLKICVI